MKHSPEVGRASFEATLRRMLHSFECFDTQWRVDWGLSGTEKLVVTHLWATGGASMSELAGIAGVSSGGATAIVDRLERDGYLERHPDAGDRRRQLVRLTDHGRAVRSRLDGVIRSVAVDGIDVDVAQRVLEEIAEGFERDADVLRDHLVERAEAGGGVAPLRG